MDARYVKTDAGRAALRERSQALTRHARTLLLVIDATHSGVEWVGLVAGTSLADLQALIDGGWVEVAAAPAPASRPAGAAGAHAAGAAPPARSATAPLLTGPALMELLEKVSFDHLYEVITAQARAHLGLIKGYRVILDVEKCANPEELRALAARFVDMVREAEGADAARRLCQDLSTAA